MSGLRRLFLLLALGVLMFTPPAAIAQTFVSACSHMNGTFAEYSGTGFYAGDLITVSFHDNLNDGAVIEIREEAPSPGVLARATAGSISYLVTSTNEFLSLAAGFFYQAPSPLPDTMMVTCTPGVRAVSQVVSTRINRPVTISLASGAMGNPTSAALVGTVTGGTVTGFPSMTVTFTPDRSYKGTATFQFTLSNAGVTSNVATASIIVGPPPPATIYYLNQNVVPPSLPFTVVVSGNAANPQTVAVGEQIILTTAPAAESGQTQQWDIPGSPIKTYNLHSEVPPCASNNPNNSCAVVTSLSDADEKATTVTFYWTVPGTYTVSYTYTLSDGLESKPSTAKFQVVGPTNVDVTTKSGKITPPIDNTQGNVLTPICKDTNTDPSGCWLKAWYLMCGLSSPGQYCVQFAVTKAVIPTAMTIPVITNGSKPSVRIP